MKKKETIINRMLDILAEAHDLDISIVDHGTFYRAWTQAIDELEYEESEDGELDFFKFTVKLGDRYFGFYQEKLKPILIAEGLTTKEQLMEFNKKTFVLKEE